MVCKDTKVEKKVIAGTDLGYFVGWLFSKTWRKKKDTFCKCLIFIVGPAGLEPDRALKKFPVGIYSEGDSLSRRLEPNLKTKKAVKRLPECGPSWARTGPSVKKMPGGHF
jgi:hypothetical protein